MTDRTQPDSGRIITSSDILLHDAETALLYEELRAAIDDGHESMTHSDALAEIAAIRAENTELRAQLEAIGAGGVSGPLVGRVPLSANAGEPVAWQYRSLPDVGGVWFDCTKERADLRAARPEIWEVRALYAAPPTAQAQGWQSIETAPKEGVFLVFMQDEVRPARRMQVANWHPNVKIVGGLFAFVRAKVTHWMPLPNPPTSAEGVEHG